MQYQGLLVPAGGTLTRQAYGDAHPGLDMYSPGERTKASGGLLTGQPFGQPPITQPPAATQPATGSTAGQPGGAELPTTGAASTVPTTVGGVTYSGPGNVDPVIPQQTETPDWQPSGASLAGSALQEAGKVGGDVISNISSGNSWDAGLPTVGQFAQNVGTGFIGATAGDALGQALYDATGNKYAGKLGQSAGNYLGKHYAGQAFDYGKSLYNGTDYSFKNPDWSNMLTSVGGGFIGNIVGSELGDWVAEKTGNPIAGGIAGAVGNHYGTKLATQGLTYLGNQILGNTAATATAGAAAGGGAGGGAAAGAGSSGLAAWAGPVGWVLAGLTLADSKVKQGIVDWGDYADVSAPLKTYEQDKTLGVDVDNERMPGWGYKGAALLSTLSLDPSDWVQGHKYGVEAVKDLTSGGKYGEGERDRAQQKADVSSLAGQGYRMRDSKFDRFLDPAHEDMSDAEWSRRMQNPAATAQQMMRLGVQPTEGDPIWALWQTHTRRTKGKDMESTYQNIASRMGGDVSLLEKALQFTRNKNQRKDLLGIINAAKAMETDE